MTSTVLDPPQATRVDTEGPQWFGQPRGLSTLFFTEMWERFSYYGMRALLILFMTDSLFRGLGMSQESAGAIYGLYTFGVYALALPGGWIADRLVGQRKAVLYGGVLIACGHFSMAVPTIGTFYVGLCLIALGTGLLKPNVSAIVGDLYGTNDARRDAGFSIFYMGINLGALAGPAICGQLLGEPNSADSWRRWHYGFGAAGVGMTLALIQYVAGAKYMRGAGELKDDFAKPEKVAEARRQFVMGIIVVVLLAAALIALTATGVLPITLVGFVQTTGWIVLGISVVYFTYVIIFGCRDNVERSRVGVCALLFLGAALFWSGFEQAGSTMTLFGRDYTNRVLFGWEFAASLFQSVNPIYIVLLAPVMGMLWVRLGARNPSIPVKFGYGLVLLGVSFLVLAWGSSFLEGGNRVGPQWLIVTYFLQTVGELCLSPVGLSSMTKLAPHRLVGQMMGMWFMGAALGNLIAGLVSGYMEALSPETLFRTVAATSAGAGLLFWIFSKPIKRLSHGVN